jgi:YfiH family protein
MMNLQWPHIAGIHALCTTRAGGHSVAPYDSLNLGDHVGDDPALVAHNRSALAQALDGAHPVFLKQVHGVEVVPIDANTPDGLACDAAFTRAANVACTIMVADCLPVLLVDAQGSAVAAAHAGWRGLAAGVLEQTVQALCRAAQCQASDIRVWLGPCIGPAAFEVGDEVRRAFVAQHPQLEIFFTPKADAMVKWLADLSGLARWRLQHLGVQDVAGNDGSAAWCTVQQRSRFFSFRRDGVTGRFAACIWRSV